MQSSARQTCSVTHAAHMALMHSLARQTHSTTRALADVILPMAPPIQRNCNKQKARGKGKGRAPMSGAGSPGSSASNGPNLLLNCTKNSSSNLMDGFAPQNGHANKRDNNAGVAQCLNNSLNVSNCMLLSRNSEMMSGEMMRIIQVDVVEHYIV